MTGLDAATKGLLLQLECRRFVRRPEDMIIDVAVELAGPDGETESARGSGSRHGEWG